MNFAAALSNATDRVYASAGVAARHADPGSVQTPVTGRVEPAPPGSDTAAR